MTKIAKFRKRPVQVEAMRYATPDDVDPILWWIRGNGGNAHRNVRRDNRQVVIVIETLEGDMEASPGDWVIRGVKGEFYPCRDDIFRATYEPVAAEEVSDGAR